ncbi:hypothetical protein RR42_m0007 [Cupriavidus basilensis]|uniref:Uncharacterized protein n=1 Tax=Cupriavidus basilensis TaxID=68895 RepID=A0A0C4XYD3_9BURK|nr:hypothetical protein RR42_m0007 [Cupriavidus basilensis]
MSGIQLGLPASRSSSRTCCDQARLRAFSNQIALELGQRSEDMKHQLSGRTCRLDLFGDALKADPIFFQLCNDTHQIR